MMKVKGINISPAEVESLLVQHHLVDEAFVFGLATPDGDQSVGCVLVSTVAADAREALIGDVRDWMAGRAAAYKTPTTVAGHDGGGAAADPDRQGLQAAAAGGRPADNRPNAPRCPSERARRGLAGGGEAGAA